jgi:type VII secretion integral membrane protein EccD
LLLTTTEPPVAEWVDCDPCRAIATGGTASDGSALRILPAICCVLLGGFGAVALAWPAAGIATAGRIVTGTCLAVAAAVGAAVVRRLHGDPLICVPLSLIAVLYAGTVGFLAVGPSPPASALLLASAVTLSSAILLLRVTGCGRTCLTAIATVSALIAAVAATGVTWRLQVNAGGAALVILSVATLGFAPRVSMALSGTTPSTPNINGLQDAIADTLAHNAGLCHRTLSGLVVGSSIAAALGTISIATGAIRDAGAALSDTSFIATVALVLLLRIRTHVDPTRRIGLTAAAVLTATAGFVAVAISAPAQAHVISVLAAGAGAAALASLARPTVSPIILRATEIAEYLALAAVIPMACWVGGIYGWAREMSLI